MTVEAQAVRLLGIQPGRHATDSLIRTADAVIGRLTYAQLDRFRIGMEQSRAAFASTIHLSERTLARYASDETRRVEPDVAERALRMARIRALAEFVLEDVESAKVWLRTPQPAMGERVPADLLRSEFGAREVERLLQRIEHGVYT